MNHDDAIKGKYAPRYWPFAKEDQWRGALMLSLIWDSTNGWSNYRDAGELKRHRVLCDVTVMHFVLGSKTIECTCMGIPGHSKAEMMCVRIMLMFLSGISQPIRSYGLTYLTHDIAISTPCIPKRSKYLGSFTFNVYANAHIVRH